MPRYYLHLRDGREELLDEEGKELADVAAAQHAAVTAARDVMVGDILGEGIINFRYRIDVEDKRGDIVFSLSFSAALAIQYSPTTNS